MMLRRQQVQQPTGGLRTRYAPRCRINQGLIVGAPWIDLLLVVGMFVLFEAKLVVRPGVVIDVPDAALTDGLHGGMIAVALRVKPAGRGQRRASRKL